MTLEAIVAVFRDATWLDAKRARAYVVILAVVTGLGAIAYLLTARNGIDLGGKPIGTDFASFWTASRLALAGAVTGPWDLPLHRMAQADAFGPDAGYAAFFYPPPYLLVCLPLGLMPYLAALTAWLLATGAAYVHMLRHWLGEIGAGDIGLLTVLAFPAVLVNAGHGQNGFLTAALLGGGAMLSDRRPWLAGLLFGSLVIKPHLAVLVPIYLLLSRNWIAIIATGLSALAWCLAATLAFGLPAWSAFIEASQTARAVLDDDLVGFAKMQSAFAAVRLVGGSLKLAIGVQMLTISVAIAGLIATARSASPTAKAAVLCAGTLLTTPFLLDYDLTLAAMPLAWLFADARARGFLPWDRLLLLVGFVLPLVSRPLAMHLYLPIAPLVLVGLVRAIARRADGAIAAPGRSA